MYSRKKTKELGQITDTVVDNLINNADSSDDTISDTDMEDIELLSDSNG